MSLPKRLRIASAVVLWTWPCMLLGQILGSNKGWSPEDSVVYHPRTKLYFVYQRDSLSTWVLTTVMGPEDFLLYRERKLLSEAPVLNAKNEPPKEPSKKRLTFRAAGEASLRVGGTTIEDDAPTLPLSMRKRSYADVLFESNMALEAKYGDHLRLDLHYNTQSSMVRNRSTLRLSYEGDPFDPIERLQAGHISFLSANPLITTGSDLFGLKGDLRLGRLRMTLLASRQHDMERKILIGAGGSGIRPFEWRSSDYQFAKNFFLLKSFADSYDARLADLPLVRSNLLVERIEVWVTSDQGVTPSATAVPVTVSPSWALTGGQKPSDFRKLPSAIRLSESDYYFNPLLGFLSLRVPLGAKQRLAVAFSYSEDGVTKQIGAFASDGGEPELALLADEQKVPSDPLWPLMMKNGYPLPRLSEEGFTLNILYAPPGSGVEEATESDGTPWLNLFGLDKSNASGDGTLPDGYVDELPGILYLPEGGTLFLPKRHPFASIPKEAAKQYAELYDRTPYDARKVTDKDRFILRGEARGSLSGSGESVSLGSSELVPGSVTLAARGGRAFVEGTDYEIDYTSGTLRMITPVEEEVEVTIREKELTRAKEKNLLGLEAEYRLMPSLSLGATLLHYYETSPLERLRLGEEPVRNTLWGLHLRYSESFPQLTSFLDEHLPGRITGESGIDAGISYARLHAGYNTKGAVSIEDFDQNGRIMPLTAPEGWKLGSSPIGDDPRSKDRRALLSWYTVDPMLVRDGMEGQPASVKADKMGRADPLVREWAMTELFPSRDQNPLGQLLLPTLNLSYYPSDRGPYATDASILDARGEFVDPEASWGSVVFPLQINDFQAEQVTYLEGWFIDPYSLDPEAPRGTLLWDLGRVSEDILPDGEAAYESAGEYTATSLGRVPAASPAHYAFDRTGIVPMERQDKGLDGMDNDEERVLLAASGITGDDPSRDDYRFYLDPYYDQTNAGIIDRYRQINGTERNGISRVIEGRETAKGWEPDREDLDGNYLLDTDENFFRYEMPLAPSSDSRIIGEHIIPLKMPDGTTREIRWVKFRIPLSDPSAVRGRPLLQDIRSLRLSLTGFAETVHLRFAELRLVSSSWQVFDLPIDPEDRRTATASLSRLSVEEDGARTPIPYVSPPGIVRNASSNPVTLLRADEESAVLTFGNLDKDQPVAIFRNPAPLDLRHYRFLSLFSHLESVDAFQKGDIELFVRLGTDFTDNFYEIRLALSPTPTADFSALSPLELSNVVWPEDNRLRLDLSLLPRLKETRDARGASPMTLFSSDSRLFVKGYPTLGGVTSILIGARSRREGVSKGEIWVDELAVEGTRETGGDAFLTTADLRLGDLLRLRADGGWTSAGFGPVSQDARFAPLEDARHFSFRASFRPEKFLPESWSLSLPVDFSFHGYGTTPLYSPTETDMLFDSQKDSAAAETHKSEYRLTLDDWKILRDPASGKLRFYDPSLLSLSYDLLRTDEKSPQYPMRLLRSMHAILAYDYRPSPGNLIRLSSEWNRVYRKDLFPSSASSALRSQWFWNRDLRVKITPVPEVSASLTSSTEALVEEPFEAAHLRGEADDFRLFTREIAHSLLSLGATQAYAAAGEVDLSLPRFSADRLKSLSGLLSLRNNFNWDSGVTTANSFMGNDVNARRSVDARLSYDFGNLLPKEDPSRRGILFLHFRRTTGGTLPGFALDAYKAFGLPELYLYQIGLAPHARQIEKAIGKGWFLSPEDAPSRIAPSYFSRHEAEASFTSKPWRGLDITLSLSYRDESHTTLDALSGNPIRESGSMRFSTIALKGLFDHPLRNEGYDTSVFQKMRERLTSGAEVTDAFLSSLILPKSRRSSRTGLPLLSALLPNWSLSYDFTEGIPGLKGILTGIKLEHRYNGFTDIPLFDYADKSRNGAGIRSVTISDDLNPLIGISVTTAFGLTVKERYNRRRSETLLATSLRALEQEDYELSSFCSYSKNFPALFKLPFPLFDDARHTVTANFSHLYTRSYLLTRMIETGSTNATQGLDTHRIQASVDYSFSRALTVRAFYELTRRRPLVTLYDYPFRQQAYGILFLLNLR